MGQPHETGNTLPNTRNLCPKPCPSGQEKNGCAFFRNVVDKGSFWSLRKGRWRLCCVIKAAKRRPKPSDPHKPHIRVDLTHLLCVCCTAMLKIRGEDVSWATPADNADLLTWSCASEAAFSSSSAKDSFLHYSANPVRAVRIFRCAGGPRTNLYCSARMLQLL